VVWRGVSRAAGSLYLPSLFVPWAGVAAPAFIEDVPRFKGVNVSNDLEDTLSSIMDNQTILDKKLDSIIATQDALLYNTSSLITTLRAFGDRMSKLYGQEAVAEAFLIFRNMPGDI
jgi:hypothetical protein